MRLTVALIVLAAVADARFAEETARHDLARMALLKWASDTPKNRDGLAKARAAYIEACRRCATAAACEDEAIALERLDPAGPGRVVCD